MAAWQIRVKNKPEKFLEELEYREESYRESYENALAALSTGPYPRQHPPLTIRGLKGELKGHYEYRSLPNGERIIFRILPQADWEKEHGPTDWDANCLGVIEIVRIGPHLK